MSTLLIALIYLLAALVAVPLARAVGLSSVLGYLIAGAVIGPHGLELVGDQSAVMRFAEYGVVVMLFLIGLELKADELWRLRGQIFGIGLAQVAITAFVLSLILLPFFDHWQSAVGIGLIFASSSTALVLETYREKGWHRADGGRLGFATLLFQDIAVIPLIIGLPLLAVPELISVNSDMPIDTGHAAGHVAPIWVVAITIVAIVIAGRYLVRPAFRVVANAGSSELFTVAALAIVIGVAILMEEIGLSPALGAFLAGVVLAENEYRHEIESDLQPFRGILLGLFFLTVGAGIDMPAFLAEPMLIIGAVLALIFVKAGIAYFIASLAKLERYSRGIYAFSLAQAGEFAFVLIALAVGSGTFTAGVGDRLLIIVTLSMLLSPIVIMVWEYFAEKNVSTKVPIHDTPEAGEVIVAGFGRFGQIVTRLLRTQGFNAVVLDSDASQVETVRRFGNTVFFGDAAREDLLRSAGADEAALLVVAVDAPAKSMEIVECAQAHFPKLKIAARARNRQHAYELLRKGVDVFERETFVSSIELGVKTLQILGVPETRAKLAAAKFRAYDEHALLELEQVWGDDRSYGLAVRRSLETLKETLDKDLEEFGNTSEEVQIETELVKD